MQLREFELSSSAVELAQGLSAPGELLKSLKVPAFLRASIAAEMLEAAICESKESIGRSGLDVWLELVKHGTLPISVFGGTKLRYRETHNGQRCENLFRLYYDWAHEFGEEIVRAIVNGHSGLSIFSGLGANSIPMAGIPACVMDARSRFPESKSIAGGVLSGLEDEPYTDQCDPRFVVRRQQNTLTRELLLLYFSLGGILVFPGYIGSLTETFLALFNAYVAGRSALNFPFKVPIVLLDMPNSKEGKENRVHSVLGNEFILQCRGHGETLYTPIDLMLKNAELHGMTKSHVEVGIHRIDVTDPSGVQRAVSIFRDHQLEKVLPWLEAL